MNDLPLMKNSILLPQFQADSLMQNADSELDSKLNKQQIIYNPSDLLKKYKDIKQSICQQPQDKRHYKSTNIPKFLLNLFFCNAPIFPSKRHNHRLRQLNSKPLRSKNRFHLADVFGLSDSSEINIENELNRRVLRRLLNRNYTNILTNKHIRNKKLYLMFCKKMQLRLNNPETIDRLQM